MDADEILIKKREYIIEICKIVISILTPLVLLALTFVVNDALQRRGEVLKREEQILAEKQRIYAELGRSLNIIYVYVDDVGDFSDYTPDKIVEKKRDSDRRFFMYRPYWSRDTESNYQIFMRAAFQTYNGAGMPAKINASKSEKEAACDISKVKWNPKWDEYFTENKDPEISKKYYALVSSLLADTVRAEIRDPQH
jgi:hypothetical protein